MLFLLVTLGFIAENIREEQVKEHQTVSVLSQLRQELMLDTANFNTLKITHGKLDTAAEFIAYYILNNKLQEHIRDFYLLNHYIGYRAGIFETKCIALDQLKYAGVLKNIKQESIRIGLENYSLSLKMIETRVQREQDFMNKFIDELRMEPFNTYKAYDSNKINFNLVKGETISRSVFITTNGVTLGIDMVNTFIPEQLILKPFNQRAYLDKIFLLNTIRNSTQERQYDVANKRASDLIAAIEKYYPELTKEAH